MRLAAFAPVLILALFCCTFALADDAALPSVLPCLTKCAVSIAAVPIDNPPPDFPKALPTAPRKPYDLGVVTIHYVIGIDGHVRDAMASLLIGPQETADIALAAIRKWTFHPALLDGNPVEQAADNNFIYVINSFQGTVKILDHGVLPSVLATYSHAADLANNGKPDDALALIKQKLADSDLNLYEIGTLTYLRALIDTQQNDCFPAKEMLDRGTVANENVDYGNITTLSLRLRIEDALCLGEIADALQRFDRLKSKRDIANDDPLAKSLAEARARADAVDHFGVQGRIPTPQIGYVWYHPLYRRNFSFQNITGTLDHFQLSCKQAMIETSLHEKAEGHVPPDWSDCSLYVFGTPGTTFDLIEAR
jgi:hypothetical protein